jgi:hypothetical protein
MKDKMLVGRTSLESFPGSEERDPFFLKSYPN